MAKKTFIGIVTSNKMAKTVVVEIGRKVKHPIYKKMINRSTKIKADTNGMEVPMKAKVKIEATRPLSADKFFKVIEIFENGNKKKVEVKKAQVKG